MIRKEMLNLLNEKICSCTKCPELVANRTQTVLDSGNSESRILFVGEAPGQNEDEQGEVFVGQAGILLTNIMAAVGFTRNDVYIINPIKCRPPNNRKPTDTEIKNCSGFFKLQIQIVNPKFIVCLGAIATKAILDIEESIGLLRGRWYDYQDGKVNAKALVTYHPAYALRKDSGKKEIYDDLLTLRTSL